MFAEGSAPESDIALASLLDEALTVRERLLAEPGQTITGLATGTGECRKRLTQLLALSWMSPRIIEAIVDGRQPTSLTHASLLQATLPTCWAAQAEMLGLS